MKFHDSWTAVEQSDETDINCLIICIKGCDIDLSNIVDVAKVGIKVFLALPVLQDNQTSAFKQQIVYAYDKMQMNVWLNNTVNPTLLNTSTYKNLT